MITFYAVPRRFEPPFDTIQHNAVLSWKALGQGAQVVLLGDAETRLWADTLGVEFAPADMDAEGIPFVRAAIEMGEAMARYELRCFLNADNIAMPGFLSTAYELVRALPQFVAIGRRVDMAVHGRLARFDGPFEARVRAEGRPGGSTGMDFFLYRGVALAEDMPAGFRIGRDFYDNWLVRHWALSSVPLVDVSGRMTIVHQDHPRKPTATKAQMQRNRDYADLDGRYGFERATWRLGAQGVKRA